MSIRTAEEIERALDWLDGHSDEISPENWPIIVDKHTAKQVLQWVLNERRIGDSKEQQA